MKYLTRFLFVAVFFIAGCASMPRTQDIPVANTKHTIYLIYRGFHTSILLDAKQLAAQNPQLAEELAGQAYARVGWGDGDYRFSLKIGKHDAQPVIVTIQDGEPSTRSIEFRMPVTKAEALRSARE